MGQKRRNKNDNKLPKYVYPGYKTYDYKPVLDNGKRGYFRLCSLDDPVSHVWEAWEKLQNRPVDTLGWLLDKYLDSHEFHYRGKKPKSKETIKQQKRHATGIKNFKVKRTGTFGDCRRAHITKGVIRAYLDKRAEQGAPVLGNREKALISKSWNWALERDIIFEQNPCIGVTRNPEEPRTRYITQDEYRVVYNLSKVKSEKSTRPPPLYIPICMEIAYLCRMRISEVLAITKSDIMDDGLLTRRLKGSNDALTLWSDRLRSTVNDASFLSGRSVMLLHDSKGSPIKYSAFKSGWSRLMKKAESSGVRPFPFHDLKAAGVSDFDGDKQAASGHKTVAMVAVYDRKLKRVKSTD